VILTVILSVIGYPLARVGRSAPIKVPVQGRKLASVEA